MFDIHFQYSMNSFGLHWVSRCWKNPFALNPHYNGVTVERRTVVNARHIGASYIIHHGPEHPSLRALQHDRRRTEASSTNDLAERVNDTPSARARLRRGAPGAHTWSRASLRPKWTYKHPRQRAGRPRKGLVRDPHPQGIAYLVWKHAATHPARARRRADSWNARTYLLRRKVR